MTQTTKRAFGAGSAPPARSDATASAATANGRPYTNRTKVAASVPADATRLRCAALRTVCASAAPTVIGIQAQARVIIGVPAARDRDLRRLLSRRSEQRLGRRDLPLALARERLRARGDRRQPVAMAGVAPRDDVEERALERARDRARPALADRAPVELHDRRHLGRGAAEERLVGDVHVVA